MKYLKPKLFKPTQKQKKEAALKLSKHLSQDKVLITQAGEKMQGTKTHI